MRSGSTNTAINVVESPEKLLVAGETLSFLPTSNKMHLMCDYSTVTSDGLDNALAVRLSG